MITTPRERFTAALNRQPLTGRVPHFELVFFLTMEAFGKLHPSQRCFHQWDQMEDKERQLHRVDIADTYIMSAEKYGHSAIFPQCNPYDYEETIRLLDIIRDKTGGEYFLMLHGDATYAIPNGDQMLDFSYRMADDPDGMKAEADKNVNNALEMAAKYAERGVLDGWALCSDYCLNTGPFLSPAQFGEFVAPYLAKLIKGYRDMCF
jgi:uroporphyrinogen decarboxylase